MGLAFAQQSRGTALASAGDLAQCDFQLAYAVALALTGMCMRSFPEKLCELAKVVCGFVFFLLPGIIFSVEREDWRTLAAFVLFGFAGIVIGPDRERCILGVRRENIFHYCIGASSYGMALGLAHA